MQNNDAKLWQDDFMQIASGLLNTPLKLNQRIKCPIHQGNDNNCHVYKDHLYCYSHGCGKNGRIDAPTLHQALTGGDFKDFLKSYNYDEYKQPLSKKTQKELTKAKYQYLQEARCKAEKQATLQKQGRKIRLDAYKAYRDLLNNNNLINCNWRAILQHKCNLALNRDKSQDWRLLLTHLFTDDAIIWLGDVKSIGTQHFKPLKDWMQCPSKPFSRFALCEFNHGATRRIKDNISKCNYLLLECDELLGKKPVTEQEREANKVLSFALFSYLRSIEYLNLVAIYDTGGKSLHAIFKMPSKEHLERLKSMAGNNGLGIDAQPLTQPNAPLRLPNTPHEQTNQPATLYYLNPKQN